MKKISDVIERRPCRRERAQHLSVADDVGSRISTIAVTPPCSEGE